MTSPLTSPLAPLPLCGICYEPVCLETCKTDEHGTAVHEECYVLKVQLFEATKQMDFDS